MFKPRHGLTAALCGLLAGLACGAASAAPVTFGFSGTVTSDPFGLSSFGAPIVGQYTFDSAAGNATPGTATASYASAGPAFGFSANVDGSAYTLAGSSTINLANDIGVDQYGVIATDGVLTLEILLESSSQAALADVLLPLEAPALADFDVREFRLFAPDAEYLGRIDSLACLSGCGGGTVPEPASLLLAASSLAAAGLARRRGRVPRRIPRPTPFPPLFRSRCMTVRSISRMSRCKLVLALALALPALPALAVDGVVLIDQNKALAGGVSAGDAPGFPVTISRAGSYRLSSNLTVPDGADGIDIYTDNVILDLNGFTIQGSGTAAARYGVWVGVSPETLKLAKLATVSNGTISKMRFGAFAQGEGSRWQNLTISDNLEGAIATGNHSVVVDNLLANNGDAAQVGLKSMVRGNMVYNTAPGGAHLEVYCPSNVTFNVAGRISTYLDGCTSQFNTLAP